MLFCARRSVRLPSFTYTVFASHHESHYMADSRWDLSYFFISCTQQHCVQDAVVQLASAALRSFYKQFCAYGLQISLVFCKFCVLRISRSMGTGAQRNTNSVPEPIVMIRYISLSGRCMQVGHTPLLGGSNVFFSHSRSFSFPQKFFYLYFH